MWVLLLSQASFLLEKLHLLPIAKVRIGHSPERGGSESIFIFAHVPRTFWHVFLKLLQAGVSS